MYKPRLPFPYGHDPKIEEDLKIISKGRIDKSTEGQIITIKGFTEEDIRDTREMIIKEMKKQRK